jgi:hypothetical protein
VNCITNHQVSRVLWCYKIPTRTTTSTNAISHLIDMTGRLQICWSVYLWHRCHIIVGNETDLEALGPLTKLILKATHRLSLRFYWQKELSINSKKGFSTGSWQSGSRQCMVRPFEWSAYQHLWNTYRGPVLLKVCYITPNVNKQLLDFVLHCLHNTERRRSKQKSIKSNILSTT